MKLRTIGAVSLLILASWPMTLARADATLTMQDAAGTPQTVIEVKGHMARMSIPGQPDYLLYDASRDVIIQVNSDRREYTEIDRAALNEFSAAVSDMREEMAQMREELKHLPPEQRAMIEQQMGMMAGVGAAESKTVQLVKQGSSKVAGFDCQRYAVVRGEERLSELCLATAADAGISKADFETLKRMMAFLREMAGRAQEMSAGLTGGAPMMLGGAEGVPVSVKDLKSGREYSVDSVSDDALNQARFTDYKTYKQQMLPAME